MRTLKVRVKPQENRLDKFLVKELKDFSRNRIQNLIEAGFIKVNGEEVDSDYKLNKNDSITVQLPPPNAQEIKAENIPLKIVFEDQDILVIDKPFDLVVHPTSDHKTHTLVNALLFHYSKLKDVDKSIRPGIVHRLDKDTSGLIVVAKNQEALEDLKNQFQEGKVSKRYLALVHGRVLPDSGEIATSIGRHPVKKLQFAVVEDGRKSITRYKVVKYFGDKFTLLELEPKTGRTHQLRVHLSSIGHPIVGDKLYGGKMIIKRQFLHAGYLSFIHPRTKERVEFTSDLPEDLKKFLESL